MNKEEILAVADLIEREGRVDLDHWFIRTLGEDQYFFVPTNGDYSVLKNECNTEGCIAGWVMAHKNIAIEDSKEFWEFDKIDFVAETFGLTRFQSHLLCFNETYFDENGDETSLWPEDRKDAVATAKMLRQIAYGEIVLPEERQ